MLSFRKLGHIRCNQCNSEPYSGAESPDATDNMEKAEKAYYI